jgi:SAM-dependent methyltransferase
MRVRTAAGRFLTRFGRFVQSLAVAVMRPEDLVEYSRLAYANPAALEFWAGKGQQEPGFEPAEKAVIDRVPAKGGRALVLGVGGGREAILLAKLGYSVTGVDFVPALVERARANARDHGIAIEGLVQDIARLDVGPSSYDLACLFAAMYSGVPTRARRIDMLKRVWRALKPGGHFLCGYQYLSSLPGSAKADRLRRIFAFLTFGNTRFEKGDMLWREAEFIHTFWSPGLLRAEFEEGGFGVVDLGLPVNSLWGLALLRKPDTPGRESS